MARTRERKASGCPDTLQPQLASPEGHPAHAQSRGAEQPGPRPLWVVRFVRGPRAASFSSTDPQATPLPLPRSQSHGASVKKKGTDGEPAGHHGHTNQMEFLGHLMGLGWQPCSSSQHDLKLDFEGWSRTEGPGVRPCPRKRVVPGRGLGGWDQCTEISPLDGQIGGPQRRRAGCSLHVRVAPIPQRLVSLLDDLG